jgi:hypothetical protein
MSLELGTCALCLYERPLVGCSHIIPKSFFKSLFDERQKINMAVLNREEGIRTGATRSSNSPYDEYILCSECEKRLGKNEDHAFNVLFRPEALRDLRVEHEQLSGDAVTYVSGLRYDRFKLFWLGVLWKAHISAHDFYSKVALGPQHAEKLRRALLASDPGGSLDYPVVLSSWRRGHHVPPDLVSDPSRLKLDNGSTYYAFQMHGYLAFVHVGSRPVPDPFDKICLQEDGSLVIYNYDRAMAIKQFDRYTGMRWEQWASRWKRRPPAVKTILDSD